MIPVQTIYLFFPHISSKSDISAMYNKTKAWQKLFSWVILELFWRAGTFDKKGVSHVNSCNQNRWSLACKHKNKHLTNSHLNVQKNKLHFCALLKSFYNIKNYYIFFGLGAQASIHSTTSIYPQTVVALSAIVLKLVDFPPLSIVDVEYCQWKNKGTSFRWNIFVNWVAPDTNISEIQVPLYISSATNVYIYFLGTSV